MPLYFLDTSALVKRYVPKTGSTWTKSLCEAEQIAILEIAFAEIASALARWQRGGHLSAAQVATAWMDLLRHTDNYTIIEMSRIRVQRIGSLLVSRWSTFGLRSLDAVQLDAAREAFRTVIANATPIGAFVASDQRLLHAAQSLGMTIDDPNLHP